MDHIAHRRARRTRDDRHAGGKGGNLLLVPRVEESLLLEATAHLLEADLQRTGADRFDAVDDDLVVAALRVDGQCPARAHLHAALRFHAESLRRRAPDDGAQLRALVLEREVEMAGRVLAQPGDLGFQPDALVVGFQHRANFGLKFAYRVDTRLSGHSSKLEA